MIEMSIDDYMEQIEKYFSNRAKDKIDLCWVDREAVACWKNHDIPLKLVFEGIDSAFLSDAELKNVSDKIIYLYQCHRYVLESWFEQKLEKYRLTEKEQSKLPINPVKLNEYIDRAISVFNTARFKAEQRRNFKLIDLLDRNYKNLMNIREIFLHSSGLGANEFNLAMQEIEWDLDANISNICERKEVEKIRKNIIAQLDFSPEDIKVRKNDDLQNKLLAIELRKLYQLYPFPNMLN